jgi:deazaflavin-dependent oxidoreductase (nitroreductase family)
MPAPRWIARFNKHVTNRATRPLAGRLPGFGVVVHIGRTTGRDYRTPVNVFSTTDGYAIALTYGSDSQWVRNVMASGGCTLETRGQPVRLTAPRLVHDEQRRFVPAPVRLILGLLHVADFLILTAAERSGAASSEPPRPSEHDAPTSSI